MMGTLARKEISDLAEALRSVYGENEAISILERIIEHPESFPVINTAFAALCEARNNDLTGTEEHIRLIVDWYSERSTGTLH
jgi:hypothetical protein